jgi:NAD(P)H-flavin reductase/hemoglobin-like flavoprotein
MDTAALKASWGQATALGDQVPSYFYAHLFVHHPEVRDMFPIRMTDQRDKLVAALGAAVSNVDQLDSVVPVLEQLGRDHRRFGAVTAHFDAVGASLLATLKHFFGPAWTAELHETWSEAYGTVAKVMVTAAEQDEDRTPAVWEAEVVGFERRTVEVAVFEVVPAKPFSYRAGQSIAVKIPQRPREWRYYSPANAPEPSGRMEFHVQPIDGGLVSGTLVHQLRRGDVVKLASPVGQQLTLPDDGPLPDLLMVAGGTGLAPFRAVLQQIDQRFRADGPAPLVHLFHGARMPWNLYDHKYLLELTRKPWFDYTPVVSEDQTYPGARGLVGEVAAQAGDWSQRVALVCGSPAMVEQTTLMLEAAGVPSDAIRREQFNFHAVPPRRAM